MSVAEQVSEAVLTLTETAGVPPLTGTVQVCTGTATWTAANPGPFDAAPVADCAITAVLVRDAAASAWTADVRSLFGGRSARGPRSRLW